MADFKCVTDSISTMKTTLDEIQTTLEDTYATARAVQANLSDMSNWMGASQLVGAAFLDLVVQYHAKFAQEEGPIVQASTTFQNYLDKDDIFYDIWDEYQELEKI